MQRVLQMSTRHKLCADVFENRFDVYHMAVGKQYVTIDVCFEDFDRFVNTVTDVLINDYIIQYINKVIAKFDTCFNLQEQSMMVAEILQEAGRDEVYSAVLRVACENRIINIDGLFCFRLADYICEIELLCGCVADRYIQKNEYLDFIRMLRFFASVNQSDTEMVHVVIDDDTACILDADFKKLEISRGCHDSEIASMESVCGYAGVVSDLVEVSPRNIVVHNQGSNSHSDLAETLVNIFDDKVSFCAGCAQCITKEKD